MTAFTFATAGQIVFGAGKLVEAGPRAAAMGSRALVAAGVSGERVTPLRQILAQHGVETVLYPVEYEPTVESVQAGTGLARSQGCDLVIGFGGGSAMDMAKAIAALLANPGDLFDYLEVIGRAMPLTNPSAPCIAIPTTAGTGSEVTRNAVIGSKECAVKVSMRSEWMLPRLALVDPELTYSMPPAVTAATGLDALTQVIEPYVTPHANPITDAICREGIQRAGGALYRAYQDGSDGQARSDMALASLFGGMALANARLGAVHGFAAPIGGMFPAPHGAVCGRLLPEVMEANVHALATREPGHPALKRYDEIGRMLVGQAGAAAMDGVAWVRRLTEAMEAPGLSSYGVRPQDLDDLVEKARAASSMKGNPIQLTPAELRAILEKAL